MKNALLEKFQAAFGGLPDVITRAPGRIEFIGNHTDYNGGTVLGVAVNRCVRVAARAAGGREASFCYGPSQEVVTVDLRAPAKQAGDCAIVNYPLGVWATLPDFGLKQPAAFQFADASDLPPGAGMSSSAAIELASALAFTALTGEKPALETLAMLCRRAENEFIGVPCGILDQGVSAFGRSDHLVHIDCAGPRFSTVPLPAGTHFWVFNTHTKHALVDGLYATRHRECMEAARALGVPLLANATIELLESRRAALTAEQYLRARHVIEETGRVAAVRDVLAAGDLSAVGRLLTASHRSSQAQFGNSTAELDFLVDALVAVPGVLGARLTGGGFGGAVMALTGASFTAADGGRVAEAYRARFGAAPDVLHLETGGGACREPV